MFENLRKNKEIRELRKEQGKEREFLHQQNVMTNETSPDAEFTFRQEQQARTDLLKWQQDLDDELLTLIMTLKGYIKKDSGWEKIKYHDCHKNAIVEKKPLCNDLFIYEVVIPQLTPIISKNAINTNLEEKTILLVLKLTANEIADAMSEGHAIYDIAFTDYDLVLRILKNTMRMSLYRAHKGFTKRMDSTIIKRVEAFNENTDEQKKGLAAIFG